MSRLYEALRKSELEHQRRDGLTAGPNGGKPPEFVASMVAEPAEIEEARSLRVQATPEGHLVALNDEYGLAAEKFRVLTTRLNHLRAQREWKALQVSSGVFGEGKSLVSANLAVTIAKMGHERVLLIEGDLHQPTLSQLFGLQNLRGLKHWWAEPEAPISDYIYRLNDLPLWFLPAGNPCDQPSDILQSKRLSEAMAQFAGWFQWIIVDSTPLLPMADVNLWSRLVDGTLLVVREGVTPIKALKKGLESLDNPKLVGVVLNEASEFDRVGYYDRYYSARKAEGGDQGQKKVVEASR